MRYLIILFVLISLSGYSQTLSYKKKGQEIFNAVIFNGSNYVELQAFAPGIESFNTRGFQTVGFTTASGVQEALPGFYIVKNNGAGFLIYSPEEFNEIYSALRNENKGKLVVDNLLAALASANLTQSEKSQLVTKLSSVFIALVIGELNGARFLANALTTDTVFTAGRKTFLLAEIDRQLL